MIGTKENKKNVFFYSYSHFEKKIKNIDNLKCQKVESLISHHLLIFSHMLVFHNSSELSLNIEYEIT